MTVFQISEGKKKKKKKKEREKKSHLVVLQIAIPIGRMTRVDREQSLEGILVFL